MNRGTEGRRQAGMTNLNGRDKERDDGSEVATEGRKARMEG